MSLYGSFTLKEWLSLHCNTKEVDELFRKALKDNDEPMAVLALAELIKRGDIDLVTYAIREATNAGYIKFGTHFSTVFANALMQCGGRDPILKRISRNVQKNGFWPQSGKELFDDIRFEDLRSAMKRDFAASLDGRLTKFLESFRRDGWFAVEFGFFARGIRWDPHNKEQAISNDGEHSRLSIKDGFVLNREEIPNVLKILDEADIADVLPAFEGEELDFYTLEDGKWVGAGAASEGNDFYVTYYSVD